MDKSISCAFTGHRPNKLPWHEDERDERCLTLKGLIYDAVEAVYQAGIRHYICGMAAGCDLYFAEAVMELRQTRRGVTLEAAIPCEGQSRGWSEGLRERYNRLATECDVQTVLSESYSEGCYLRRNKYMVDRARILIAAYDGRPGGTQSTILYAIRQGLEIIELPII